MTTIAVDAPRPKSRFLLDRPELVGPLFIAPAILYVFILVALPFFLAIYYSVSAFTIFDPNYQFVGLKNFIDVIDSNIFQRALINTFIFTIFAVTFNIGVDVDKGFEPHQVEAAFVGTAGASWCVFAASTTEPLPRL